MKAATKFKVFLHTLFLENEAQTRKKKPKQCISSKTKSTCQNSTTSEHFQKWPKNQGVVLALSLSFNIPIPHIFTITLIMQDDHLTAGA